MPPRTLASHLPSLLRASHYIVIAFVAVMLAAYLDGTWLWDAQGRPHLHDFINFWTAGQTTLAGHAADSYDLELHRQALMRALGYEYSERFSWVYPPTYLPVTAGLALLPFWLAHLLWQALCLALYALMLRRIVGHRVGFWLALSFAPVFWNAMLGQNGTLMAAIIAAMFYWREHATRAGLALGLLTVKPHLGLLLPLVFLAQRKWQIIAIASATTASLIVLSLALYGEEVWYGFFESLRVTSDAILTHGAASYAELHSFFALFRELGISRDVSWCLFALVVLTLCGLILHTLKKRGLDDVSVAVITAAIPLATPYIFIYDLVILAVPLAFLLRVILQQDRLLPYEAPLMIGVWLLLFFTPMLMEIVPCVGLLASLIVLGLALRRAWEAQKVAATPRRPVRKGRGK